MSRVPPKKDFATLRDELVRAGSLFVDPDFPPNTKTLYFNGQIPADIRHVIWKRPGDIVRNPKFVVHGAGRHDLNQGLLGDCWFIAGAALLATRHRKQFNRVIPDDQNFDEKYAGIFHFNFWWYGKWVEIVVDDYLPTNGRELIYCSNRDRPDEFWSPLLEKAYAKLHGCYEAIAGGSIQDALVDFTGGISEILVLTDKRKIAKNLYDLLYKSYSMNSLMGASINKKEGGPQWEERHRNGLYGGHAYSITGFSKIKRGNREHHLLRLRNPWGRGEWLGAWSDESREMANLANEIKTDIKFRVRNEGEFWMAFEDFVLNFDQIEICHLQPDSLTNEIARDEAKKYWNVIVYHDAWIKGVTAGGCGNEPYTKEFWYNPQFFVTLEDVDDNLADNLCTMIISLMEKDKGDDTRLYIEFNVYQLKSKEKKPLDGERVASNAVTLINMGNPYTNLREVTRRLELPPAVYVIIPSTFRPFQEGEFLLRIFTEKKVDSGVLDDDSAPTITGSLPSPEKPVEDKLADLFFQFAGKDRRLDARELQAFLASLTVAEFRQKIVFSIDSCRSLLTMMDNNRSGMLDLNETRLLWREIKTYREVFLRFDKDRSDSVDTFELNTMFRSLGFPVSRAVMTSIVRRYGGRDSKINLQDFVLVVSKLIVMYNVFLEQQKLSGGGDDTAVFTRNEFLQHTMSC